MTQGSVSTTTPTSGPADRGRSSRRRSRRRIILAALGVVVLALAGVFHRPWFLGNVGVVDPGKVYRIAQPKGAGLARSLDEQGIASVLNLRGGSMSDSWYAAEVEAAGARGIDFYDLPMKAEERPGRNDLLALIDLFPQCRYPLLIHCKAGADRTGLASALYRMVMLGEAPEIAEGQFTVFHGHVPLLGTAHLHEPIDEYAAWLRAEGLEHTAERFRRWIAEEYRSDEPLADYEPLQPGSRWALKAARRGIAQQGRDAVR